MARLQERDAACMALTRIRYEHAVEEPTPLLTLQRVRGAINRFTLRLSHWTEETCAHRYATIVGLLIIIGLLAAASSMSWNLTGQLICNTPPSIIESFIMLVVISGGASSLAPTALIVRRQLDRRSHPRRAHRHPRAPGHPPRLRPSPRALRQYRRRL